MKCNYCGEKINGNENFYIVDSEICCSECCQENTHTYYTVCDNTYEEDVVVPFDTKEEAITYYTEYIDSLKERLGKAEQSDVPWKNTYIKRYKDEIKETRQLLKALKDEE